MDYFRNLSWQIKDVRVCTDILQDFVSEEAVADLPVFDLPNENLIESLVSKHKKLQNLIAKNNKKTDYRGYRKIPELETSRLTIQNHKLYLELLTFYMNGSQRSNPKINSYLTLSQKLEPIIQEERGIYSEFVKSQWTINGSEKCNIIQASIAQIFEDAWTRRIQFIDKYPSFYSTERMIPIFSKDNISVQMKHVSNLFEMGSVHSFVAASDKKRVYLTSKNIRTTSEYNYEPVGFDKKAEKLAQECQADVVISSSGIKHIINNHAPYHNTWILPVKIKEYTINKDGKTLTKKIVFIDKALPNNFMNNVQKNYWVHKKLMKQYFCKGVAQRFQTPFLGEETFCTCPTSSNDLNPEKSACERSETQSSDVNVNNEDKEVNNSENLSTIDEDEDKDSDENLVIDISEEELEKQAESEAPKTSTLDEEFKTPAILTRSRSKSSSLTPSPTHIEAKRHKRSAKCNHRKRRQLNGVNVNYKLWNLKVNTDENNHLIKNTSQEINIVIRSKIDALKKNSNRLQPLIFTPKLEYQLEYGAEICTKTDLCRQWVSSILIPSSTVMRVRIDPENSEFILAEECNTTKIKNELTTFHQCIPGIGWQCLYSVLTHLMKAPLGDYVLTHAPRNGPFVSLMRSCEKSSNCELNVQDLKIFHDQEDRIFPFNPIDTNVILQNHIKQGVIPGLFKGVESVARNKNDNEQQKKKNKKQKYKQKQKQNQKTEPNN